MNNRKHERTDCQTEATIHYQGEDIKGVVENLSLKGLFVKTDQKINVDEQVGISVHFYGADADLSFNLQATVVRAAENGLGFGFQKIDIDSLALQKKEPALQAPA
ncbi:PilZ domain-containing protein [Geomesophilobacter sediminis]|uniref:PilZ domain-containing protein n=1 Tax=Geomesophilobacter sediminis TaxID=2798584 RepID=A0A8J7JM80_9BACT|nr:PilZ domain-containing protein [Geomesophilobacter sediminis]MBJ6725745.1 PilZ domain-containing protein [Geomesophilobacter sediminis]